MPPTSFLDNCHVPTNHALGSPPPCTAPCPLEHVCKNWPGLNQSSGAMFVGAPLARAMLPALGQHANEKKKKRRTAHTAYHASVISVSRSSHLARRYRQVPGWWRPAGRARGTAEHAQSLGAKRRRGQGRGTPPPNCCRPAHTESVAIIKVPTESSQIHITRRPPPPRPPAAPVHARRILTM